ncbi:iron-siderophore ABC transporter substrate-binding protein [Nostoc sp. PCC 7120 = FACHB-418]|uniref:Iron-siderophore ABC transporter substrate-binding protein n=1 Tax=Anabaena cylindrica FACHB-318 TaxID=2692880 RepID=A0ABR7ZBU4_ANACY|nr:iron-siderophore ABC transporter substrate-binding protein [Anabaena cylindrica FACHB-318]MBD2261505.1 iron-siderophore ABC transporter substrate-binding protein [Anabaena sp. FACHB-709]MBD2271089.1 iron-siderophore ABC transporter substrate-binding protein [Nostoc sp. PCC 7120 = FACHB-418]MBD2282639.1 iron-siderophore ABC transporter substrate-binding protein [Anabaena cylindrica FACHB-170]MBD2349398.1 iron-siderophore ABC transporter substrate-binding protein [Trichormus variabilis FACHB-1
MTLTIVFFKGCHSFLTQNIYSSNEYVKSTECRIIKHKLGEICIPLNPQRIIVTDPENLEILLALGIKPIASARANAVGNKVNILDKDKVDGIINLGKESQINLERIIQLNPDLILGFSYSSQDYKLLSQIAPTAYFNYTETDWKKTLLEVAEVVNKTKKAEKLLEEYQHRIEDLKLKFTQKNKNTKISVMRFYTTIQFTQFLNELSFPVSILEELKLSIPLAQRQVSRGANVSYNNVSLERVDLLESDAMFIALDPGAEENFQTYQNSPLWQTLNVVKNNHVYTVDSGYWIFGNILSANAILDDIVKYLVE